MTTALTPVNCFAAMFDIVGFKALRSEKGTAGLHQQFTRGILPSIAHAAAGKGKVQKVEGVDMYVPDFSGTTLRYRAISDSVIFFTPDDSLDSFFAIVHSVFMLLQFGFNGGKAPYRGAIGWGDLIDDPVGILIGSAIEDAYEGESRQVWAGAMLTESCRDFVDRMGFVESHRAICKQISEMPIEPRAKQNALENGGRLVRYPVPTQVNPKDGPVIYGALETYAIDWTIRMYQNASHSSFSASTNRHATTIARNTQEFESWARQQGK